MRFWLYPWARFHRLRAQSSTRLPSFHSPATSLWFPRDTLTSDQLLICLGGSLDSLRFDYSLEDFTEFMKALNINYSFTKAQKIHIRTSQKKRLIGWCLEGPDVWSFRVLSPWSQLPASCWYVTVISVSLTREAHLSFGVQSFYWDSFHKNDWLNNWSCMHVSLAAQSCPVLCDPMDCSLPDSSVPGILQARILEWVAMPSSSGSSPSRDWTHISCTGRRILYHWATWETPEITGHGLDSISILPPLHTGCTDTVWLKVPVL